MKPSIYLPVAFAALNSLLFSLVRMGGHTHLYAENQVIENIQAGALAFAFVGLAATAPARTGFKKWLTLFFAATCLAMFLREVDVEDLQVANIIKLLGAGTGRNLIMGLSFLALFITFFMHYRHLAGQLKYLLQSRVAILSILGGLFLVCGGVFEEPDRALFEELAEMNGALLILLAAGLCMKDPEYLTGKCTEPLTRR